MESDAMDIMRLITSAPWREAVTYRETWPHEYVVIQKDAQQELLAEFCRRVLRGEGIEGHFFHQTRPYLFLGGYKYWIMDEVADIDPETYDGVLNRCPLFRDRRDYAIRRGDTAEREEDIAMAMRELGEIEEVNIREIWPHEAHNFTTWLFQSENLALLGSAVGLDLEPVRQEAPVGYFWLDILARERGHGEMVAIENQLEMTDHDHLGKSITYAAENRAAYVIWIASDFRSEHIKAIDWLNALAPEKVWFFAVEIHAIQIDDSKPAAEFRPVAVPRDWEGGNARYVIPSRPDSSDDEKYLNFFQSLVDELRDKGFTDKDEADPEYYQEFSSAVDEELRYYVSFEDDCAWVYLEWWGVKTGRERSNKIYKELNAQQEQIEANFSEGLYWRPRGNTVGFDVSTWRYATINDPQPALDEIRAWMLETLPKFREVFNPRLEKILAELEEE